MRRVRSQFPIPSLWAALVSVAVVAFGFTVATASADAASKGVVGFVGGTAASPALGGTFSSASSGIGGTAVRQSNGHVYVADRGANRIQELDSVGNFVRAWGYDVVQPGGAGDGGGLPAASEQQSVALSVFPATSTIASGTFTLTFNGQTTSVLQFDATALQVQTALQGLSSIGAGNATVSGSNGGPWTVTFTGSLANTDVPAITGTGTFTTNPAGGLVLVSVTAPVNGGAPPSFEVCTVASQCKVGLNTPVTGGTMNAPQGVAVDQSDGAVYVTDQGNRRVQKFTATGAFVWAAGWDVTTGGVTTFETCTVAANCKIAGAAGAGAGQFGAAMGYPAVDPTTGNVLIPDPTNRRVQKISSAGAFVSAFGWGVADGTTAALQTCTAPCFAGIAGTSAGPQFGTNTPTRAAVDSSGNVYTVEPNINFRVRKFNAANTVVSDFDSADTQGAGATTTPTNVAIDPFSGNVYVTKLALAAGTCPAGTKTLEIDQLGALVDTHAPCAGISAPVTAGGITVNLSGRLFVASTTTAQRVYMLDDVPAPTATMDEVSDVTQDSATFDGTVNPNTPPAEVNVTSTSYHFEYSPGDSNTWKAVPATDVDAGHGNTDLPVTAAVTGLAPNRLYHARIVASRPFGAATTTSPELTFTTGQLPPTATTAQTYQYGPTSGVLKGSVNSHNLPTTYYFEYGTDTDYGTNVPATQDADAGFGNLPKTFTRQIADLQPDTAYHYRIVARNDAGTSTGEDRTFTTGAVPRPASGVDDRAYEAVSPVDTNSVGVTSAYLASDADHAVVSSLKSFPGGSYAVSDFLKMTRHDGVGWTAERVTPPALTRASIGRPDSIFLRDLSNDAGEEFYDLAQDLDPNDQNQSESALGFNDVYARNADGSFTWVSQGSVLPETDKTKNASYVGRSDDASVVVFTSNKPLLPQDTSSGSAIYARVNGVLRLVSVLPDGSVSPNATPGPGLSNKGSDRTVSDNGTRIFFTATIGGTSQVYVRKNVGQPQSPLDGSGNCTVPTDACTVMASASKRTPQDSTRRSAQFLGASRDGSKVFFLSKEQLTPDAKTGPGTTPPGQDLYEFDVNDNTLHDLSFDPNGGDVNGAQVGNGTSGTGVAGISDDGSRVFFEAKSALTAVPNAGGQSATPGASNLYVYEGGGVTFVATLFDADAIVWGPLWSGTIDGATTFSAPALSPDGGRYTMFQSARALVSGAQTGGRPQAWLYDVGAGSTSASLRCLSCTTAPAPAPQSIARIGGENQTLNTYPQSVTSDGRAVFDTADALVSEDVNGARDVYEYAGGELHLISGGAGSDNSDVVGFGADGRDLFFLTGDSLASQDLAPGVRKLYDARVGGGFPGADFVPPAPCVADSCQGSPSVPPAVDAPESANFNGAGNVEQNTRSAISGIRKISSSDRSKLAKGGKARLRLKVNRSGTVSVAGTATLGGKKRRVVSSRGKAKKAGLVSIPFALSKSARSVLRRKRSLTVALTVRFKDARPKAVTLTLRSAASRKGGRS